MLVFTTKAQLAIDEYKILLDNLSFCKNNFYYLKEKKQMKLSQNLSRLGAEAVFKILADAKKKLLSFLTFLTLKKSYFVAPVMIIFWVSIF